MVNKKRVQKASWKKRIKRIAAIHKSYNDDLTANAHTVIADKCQ